MVYLSLHSRDMLSQSDRLSTTRTRFEIPDPFSNLPVLKMYIIALPVLIIRFFLSSFTCSSSLFLILRIYEIRAHGDQSIRVRPISHSMPLLSSAPVLSISRLCQIQWFRCHISWCIRDEDISVLSSRLRRSWRFVRHDLVELLLNTG